MTSVVTPREPSDRTSIRQTQVLASRRCHSDRFLPTRLFRSEMQTSPIFERCTFSSLTRITNLDSEPFGVEALPSSQWDTGDYVVGIVTDTLGHGTIELPSGRDMEVAEGDAVVGAFGSRQATLEMTGSWRDISDDHVMHALTRAGLFGTSSRARPWCNTPSSSGTTATFIAEAKR